MPLEARPERAKAEQMILETQLPFEQIAKDTGYTTAHIRKIAKKLKEKGATLPPIKEEEKGTEEIEKITVATPQEGIEEPKRLTQLQTDKLTEEQKTEKLALLLDQGDIEAVIQSINSWLPQERRKSPEQIEILSKTWTKVLLDFFPEGIEDKYAGLVFALLSTAIIFAPEVQTYIVPFVLRKKKTDKDFVDDTEEQKKKAQELKQ